MEDASGGIAISQSTPVCPAAVSAASPAGSTRTDRVARATDHHRIAPYLVSRCSACERLETHTGMSLALHSLVGSLLNFAASARSHALKQRASHVKL